MQLTDKKINSKACRSTLFNKGLIKRKLIYSWTDIPNSKSMGRIIAAIDIGSMWMGYAYSLKDDWEKVVSSNWATEELTTYKVPTCILLQKDFSTFWIGYEAEDKYAELISEDSHHDYFFFKRFQTNLHQNSDLNQCYDIKSRTLQAGLVFGHCIKCLKEHLTRTLEQNSIGYENDDIGYILTVPLICGEKGKIFMRNAAIKAGIIEKNLTIVFEHEAASVYCWKFANPLFDKIKTGAKYLIADLGGDTADITMLKTYEENILEEIITARTGPWGGKSVDDQFEKFLSELVEEKVWENFKRNYTDDYSKIMRNFETNKRTIKPNKSGNIQIPVPPALVKLSIESQGVKTFKEIVTKNDDALKKNVDFASGKLVFSDKFLKVFYKKSIGAILKSIDEVLNETKPREVKTIFLTGGLSECLFVQESIKKIDWKATIIVPDDAGLAVSKGAVYLGHFPDALSLKSAMYTLGSKKNLRFPEATKPKKTESYRYAAKDEWRHCVDWLVRCNILPEEHRATQPDASALDLAQTLRNGVLLCQLLNILSPNSVGLKDFSQRPHLSQFLCLKNIRKFLQTCMTVFGLSNSDLFDLLDLFELRNFRKVLTTLSKLSKTPIARKRQSGFPPEQTSHQRSWRYQDDDEDIYGYLPDLALHHDVQDNEEIYDHVYEENDDEICDDLCTRNCRESSITELPSPTTERDHCIKELLDTEKNCVDTLRMIHLQFNKPLKDIISKADRDVIFAHTEKLLEIHQKFQAELQSACISGKPKIGEVFVKYKKSLLLYGNYCSDLPKAQERLEDIARNNENIWSQIEACEQRANDGKFKLRDLLHVPTQKVLYYHILLKKLIKQSGKQAEDKDSLEQGQEAMMDLFLYVNEVKWDNENLQLIEEIQASIGDLQMPANTTLKDYGRLHKDGELKVKNHTDNKIRIRYIFLFDKVMLMCKAKGESYSFKESTILAVYKVQDQQTANRETQRRGDKWNSSFVMVKKDGSNAFSFFAKTEDMKAKWIDAIKLALENASPPQGINYVMHTFDQPTECSVCGKLLRGVFFQGYKCTDPGSDISVHKECIGKQPNTGSRVPPIPARVIEQVRALCNYTGNPNPGGGRPALRFQKDDVIKLLNNDAQWWKGLLNGDEGWFPSQLVQEIENRIRRKPFYLDVKIRSRTENGTPSNISPARAHSSANNKPYDNVVDDNRSSDQLSVYKWFVGPMGRDTANHRLEHLPNGTFLIRMSENPGRKGELSLSLRYDNQVRHIRMEKNAEGLFYLDNTKFVSSLPELVEFYQENSLADSFPGVDSTLKFPFKSQSGGGANTRILGYAEAVYDYAATATSQLSLCRGDKVAILSKTGSDKGWWKGEHCISGKNGYFPLAYVRELDDD